MSSALEERAINTVRGLAIDGPHAARSGHQGTAMALAPLAHVLWTRIMRYDPTAPEWFDRDRFILSAGHASILQYSMLHLVGYDLSLDDLKDFRQWGSATPGHPEAGHTAGIEVTTGPLGQGFANGVGMAMAERSLRARFGADVCDHRCFVVCGDGDLSEGLSHEAASLAGHQGLGRLIAVYDDNHITIDGPTDISLSDDAGARFEAYGWQVIDLGDKADDLDALEAGIREAMADESRPSLVIVRSHIGQGSPDAVDTHEAHGYALANDEIIARAKEQMGFADPTATFVTEDDVVDFYRSAGRAGAAERKAWEAKTAPVLKSNAALRAALAGGGIDGWEAELPTYEVGSSVATRKASGATLKALRDAVPGLIGGGADLTGNTGTDLGDTAASPQNSGGRQIYWGVREHAMGAAMVGMALHGGTIPFGGTFLVFSDYMRPAIRLAALSGAKAIFVFSHDSVGVGEDGPTHQPVEQVEALRLIPGLKVLRPADANESVQAWQVAIEGDGPVALILSRQNLETLAGTDAAGAVASGGYVLIPGADAPDVTLIGSGSEVAVCRDAAMLLSEAGISARVVSVPDTDAFWARDVADRAGVLGGCPVVAVEAGVTNGWYRFADDVVGIDRFGASAPGDTVMAELGINPAHVAERAQALLGH